MKLLVPGSQLQRDHGARTIALCCACAAIARPSMVERVGGDKYLRWSLFSACLLRDRPPVSVALAVSGVHFLPNIIVVLCFSHHCLFRIIPCFSAVAPIASSLVVEESMICPLLFSNLIPHFVRQQQCQLVDLPSIRFSTFCFYDRCVAFFQFFSMFVTGGR